MINFGNNSIVDMKYGSQQVAKVYHGADLVWEKDGWVEYTFPNTTNGTAVNCTALTGDGALGFTFQGGSETASHVSRVYHMFDSTSWSMRRKGNLGSSGSVYGIYAYAVFPPQWGEVLLTAVSVTNLDSSKYYRYELDSTSDRSKVIDSNGYVIVNTIENGGLETNIFDFGYKTGNSAQASLDNVSAVAIRMFATRRSSSTGEINGGNYILTFMIQKSKLKAWLDAFNLPYPDVLPQ